MMRALFSLFILALLYAVPAAAVEPDEVLKDPALEARARALSQQLRCMVCQNQSIDDSNAPLAHDLRVLVRERLTNGDSDAQVINFVVSRYGEFVLLRPAFAWHNVLLWGLPPAILLVGALAIVMVARRRRLHDQPALSDDEQRKLAAIQQRRQD